MLNSSGFTFWRWISQLQITQVKCVAWRIKSRAGDEKMDGKKLLNKKFEFLTTILKRIPQLSDMKLTTNDCLAYDCIMFITFLLFFLHTYLSLLLSFDIFFIRILQPICIMVRHNIKFTVSTFWIFISNSVFNQWKEQKMQFRKHFKSFVTSKNFFSDFFSAIFS